MSSSPPHQHLLSRETVAISLISLAASLLLAGCGTNAAQIAAGTTSIPVVGQAIIGGVHGGSQTVIGAHIYLFAAGTSGYGAPSVSLLRPTSAGVATDALGSYVLSDNSGSFTISGKYTCIPGQQVYILAHGGNPSLAAGTFNAALTLVSAIGACPGSGTFASDIPQININEVSTVAAVYSLAGFMTDALHVSSPSTPLALQGMANAFLTVPNLVSIDTGLAKTNTIYGNGVPPRATINTISNVISACIDTNGTGSACSTLFANAKNPDGSLPTDTATAALNIAHNPGANVPGLFALGVAAPSQPSLASAPNDFTVGITFYSDTLAGPYYPAFDAFGNLWVPGYANNSVGEFDPQGQPLAGQANFTGNNLNQPYNIAIDSAQTAWVTNIATNVNSFVSRFTLTGASAQSFPCGQKCSGIAFDSLQNAWIAGVSSVQTLHPAGNSNTTFPAPGFVSGLAIDSTGRGWSLGTSRNLYRMSMPTTVTQFPQTVTSSIPNDINLLAIDSADNVWFTSGRNNAIGRVDSNGALVSPAAGYTGGGLNYPAQLAVDGSNRVWVANRDGNSISGFTNAGVALTPATGFQPSGQLAPDPTVPPQAIGIRSPHGLAIDGSGNIWVTNFTANSITEILGLATPVVTPISPTTHGQRP